MNFAFRFDWWYARLPSSPADEGRVTGLVVRPAPGARECPATIEVTPQGGIQGDRWACDPDRSAESQVSLINVHVLRSLSANESSRMPLSGDNLQVDLDLSEENLPPGSLLTIGSAMLEITPQPHRPCRLFHQRYGPSGVKKVVRANQRGRRARGVLAKVVVAGTIRVGDTIHVRRPGDVRSS